MKTNRVVILIISHKPTLSFYEMISIKQCFKILGSYDIFFICPKGLDTTFYYREFGEQISIFYIPKKWLSSYRNFNKLKISPLLYKQYKQYENILFYEADAFVFKDELEYWCKQDYAYIGAPWLEGGSSATSDSKFIGVGNGGFSLRNIRRHLDVLKQFKRIYSSKDLWDRYLNRGRKERILQAGRHAYNYFLGNTFHTSFNKFDGHEDDFWGNYAASKFEWFNIPDPMTALRFSIEVQPQRMMKLNGNNLPFGCHAWWRFDLEFWRPFIEEFGYKLGAVTETSKN